ncbi:uncharacterized protein HD556DRAFT_1529488 [Suillus plorans]|uniref:Uncharacterized protein n=1 Tax=Suillus plorans TaxID=116603 RepID=A0A9P7DDT9_9AGAM|nr:uncharacterized protein HD556DRAFT_1529488 [Suillus plorans]KAG1789410.1 hypothetical protein HD556DRAFT_1529488 [Suillus plorans]
MTISGFGNFGDDINPHLNLRFKQGSFQTAALAVLKQNDVRALDLHPELPQFRQLKNFFKGISVTLIHRPGLRLYLRHYPSLSAQWHAPSLDAQPPSSWSKRPASRRKSIDGGSQPAFSDSESSFSASLSVRSNAHAVKSNESFKHYHRTILPQLDRLVTFRVATLPHKLTTPRYNSLPQVNRTLVSFSIDERSCVCLSIAASIPPATFSSASATDRLGLGASNWNARANFRRFCGASRAAGTDAPRCPLKRSWSK